MADSCSQCLLASSPLILLMSPTVVLFYVFPCRANIAAGEGQLLPLTRGCLAAPHYRPASGVTGEAQSSQFDFPESGLNRLS